MISKIVVSKGEDSHCLRTKWLSEHGSWAWPCSRLCSQKDLKCHPVTVQRHYGSSQKSAWTEGNGIRQ